MICVLCRSRLALPDSLVCDKCIVVLRGRTVEKFNKMRLILEQLDPPSRWYSIYELSDLLDLSHHTVKKLLIELEKLGLVETRYAKRKKIISVWRRCSDVANRTCRVSSYARR